MHGHPCGELLASPCHQAKPIAGPNIKPPKIDEGPPPKQEEPPEIPAGAGLTPLDQFSSSSFNVRR